MDPEDKKAVQLIPFTSAVLKDPEKLKLATEQRQAIARSRAEAQRKAQGEQPPAAEPERQVIVPFPTPWDEDLRAAPLALLRSALFGVVKRGRRRYLNEVELMAWKGVSVRYKGERLDQSDLDVWMQAIHLFRHCGLGKQIHVSAHGLLKALGRATGKQNHLWMDRSFTRMIACAVKIDVGRYVYAGNLVQEFWLDKETGKYVLSINPRLAALFQGGYSHVEWRQRQALGNKDLAKWLLGYVSTHHAMLLDPHRIGLEKLQALSGAEMKSRDFKYWTQRYMDDLKALGAVASWRFAGADDSTLEFIKPPRNKRRKGRKNNRQGTV